MNVRVVNVNASACSFHVAPARLIGNKNKLEIVAKLVLPSAAASSLFVQFLETSTKGCGWRRGAHLW